MKKFTCIILLLALTATLLISCNKNKTISLYEENEQSFKNDTPTTAQSNQNTEVSKKTENDIFLYIKNAWNNSVAYKGAYTETQYFEEHESDYIEVGRYTVSADPQSKNFFYIEEEYETSSSQIPVSQEQYDELCKEKIVFRNNTYYLLSEYNYYDESGKEYSYMSEAQVQYITSKYKFLSNNSEPIIKVLPDITIADSIDELKAAYNEVLKDYINDPNQEISNATSDIAVTESGGTFYLRIILSFIYDNSEQTKSEIYIQASNNFISKIEKSNSEGKIGAELKYTFDKQTYDSININLPENMSSIQQATFDKEITFHFQGTDIPWTQKSYGKRSIQESYNDILNDSYGLCLDDYTWYTDPKLTQKLDISTISEEEYFKIEDLYTGERNSETTLCHSTNDHGINKAYSIVYGQGSYSCSSRAMVYNGTTILFSSEICFDDAENVEIYVNGVKQPPNATHLTIDSSNIYEIHIVYKHLLDIF